MKPCFCLQTSNVYRPDLELREPVAASEETDSCILIFIDLDIPNIQLDVAGQIVC